MAKTKENSSVREDLELLIKEQNVILRDIAWLNTLIATELLQVTENTSSILRKSPPPENCLSMHNALRMQALDIAERYSPDTTLREHLTGHQ
jgi:hypothetical protein